MKTITTKTAALTAAIALIATPAFAAPGGQGKGAEKREAAKTQSQSQGKSQEAHASAPGRVCKGESRKKTNKGKGKSAFAACVLGVRRANAEAERQATREARGKRSGEDKAPGRMCRDQSRKKARTDEKSAFSACVKGVVTQRKQERAQESEQDDQDEQEQTEQS